MWLKHCLVAGSLLALAGATGGSLAQQVKVILYVTTLVIFQVVLEPAHQHFDRAERRFQVM